MQFWILVKILNLKNIFRLRNIFVEIEKWMTEVSSTLQWTHERCHKLKLRKETINREVQTNWSVINIQSLDTSHHVNNLTVVVWQANVKINSFELNWFCTKGDQILRISYPLKKMMICVLVANWFQFDFIVKCEGFFCLWRSKLFYSKQPLLRKL